MRSAVEGLQTLIDAGAIGLRPDGELLDRFIATADPAAFEAIVRRHGPMVWGVCRRLLRDHHDAEDAFQATFLVLARRAEAVRPRDRLIAWLYGVAHRTALKARAARARRRLREGPGEGAEPTATAAEPRDILAESLDRELARLPERYRLPIVLCDLEGCTHREAAERLGCPIGTLSGRHSRARALLADRLRRRGVAFSAGAWPGQMTAEASAAPFAKAIACAGRTAAVPSTVAALAREVQGGLLMTKIKTSVAVLGMVVAAEMGVVGFAQDRPEKPTAPATKPTPPAKSKDGGIVHTYYVGDIIGAEGRLRDGRQVSDAEMRPLIDLLTATIAPETWREGDEPGPSITPFFLSISLIIRHDRATHERIAVFLGQLRNLQNSRLDRSSTELPTAPLPPPGATPSTRIAPPAPTTPHSANPTDPRPELVRRSYPIGDLLGIAPGPVENPDAIPDSVWPLVDLIAENVAPGTWMKGSYGGWIRACYSRSITSSIADRPTTAELSHPTLVLNVWQTTEIQGRVETFLQDLRRAQKLKPPAP